MSGFKDLVVKVFRKTILKALSQNKVQIFLFVKFPNESSDKFVFKAQFAFLTLKLVFVTRVLVFHVWLLIRVVSKVLTADGKPAL